MMYYTTVDHASKKCIELPRLIFKMVTVVAWTGYLFPITRKAHHYNILYTLTLYKKSLNFDFFGTEKYEPRFMGLNSVLSQVRAQF